MIRGYKVRLFPTKKQMEKINQNIGASRFIWNYMLEVENEYYEKHKDAEKLSDQYLSHFDLCKQITKIRNDDKYKWLKEISVDNLESTCKDLAQAYSRYVCHKGGKPKFKARNNTKRSYPLKKLNFYEDGVSISMVGTKKTGLVRFKTKIDIPIGNGVAKFSNPRISVDTKGKVILTFGMDIDFEEPELNDKNMGIDLGMKDLAIVACGDEHIVYKDINKTKRIRDLQRKLKHLQRNVSRKERYLKEKCGGTWKGYREYVKEHGEPNNLVRERKKVKLVYEKLTNIRNDYLHNTTRELVNMNPKKITMEDLHVSNLLKNKKIAPNLRNMKWYEFRRQMEYKTKEKGIELVFANQFYPSTQTCHNCGHVRKGKGKSNGKLTLSQRTYVCPVCGYVEDRDYNAALNLRDYSE